MYKINIPELLAPAGSFDALRAAVENGCDAVYLGGKQFSARSYADNFQNTELEAAIDYCHARGVKLFVAVNTLYKDSELISLFDFIDSTYKFGADAFILQDIGAASFICQNFPGIPLHASTQMTITDKAGAEFLHESGFSRVILARELSLPEIEAVSLAPIETEVFVHGSMCVCYSGQCRFSGMLGGRSGNRGKCAQPCRLAYQLYHNGAALKGGHLLSPRDMMTLELLPEIIKTGVSSLKIEGRMKSPEYVSLTTRLYRESLDAIKDGVDFSKTAGDFSVSDLTQIFNRGGGFSTGYFKDYAGLNMMSPETPKSTGLQVGRVIRYDRTSGKCDISLNEDLYPGDGIEIWTRREPHAGTNINKNHSGGGKAAVILTGDINPGDRVYRSFDKRLADRLKKLYSTDTRRIKARFSLTARVGQNITLEISLGETYVSLEGEMVSVAQSRPVTREQLLERIMKTGGTSIELEPENIQVDDNIFLGIAGINELRRKALGAFMEKYLNSFRRNSNPAKYPKPSEPLQSKENSPLGMSVLVYSLEQLLGVLSCITDSQQPVHRLRRIYFEPTSGFPTESVLKDKQLKSGGIEIFVCLPYISTEADEKNLRKNISLLASYGIDGFLARTYGQIQLLKEAGLPFIADHNLNVFNALGLSTLSSIKQCVGVTLSTELSLDEMETLGAGRGNEIIIHGRYILMATRQCPVGLYAAGKKSQKHCALANNSSGYALKDRKGLMFPIRTDCESCTAFILNSRLTFSLSKISAIIKTNMGSLRIMLDDEDAQETADIVYAYGSMLENNGGGSAPSQRLRRVMDAGADTTFGHFFRGVQ